MKTFLNLNPKEIRIFKTVVVAEKRGKGHGGAAGRRFGRQFLSACQPGWLPLRPGFPPSCRQMAVQSLGVLGISLPLCAAAASQEILDAPLSKTWLHHHLHLLGLGKNVPNCQKLMLLSVCLILNESHSDCTMDIIYAPSLISPFTAI